MYWSPRTVRMKIILYCSVEDRVILKIPVLEVHLSKHFHSLPRWGLLCNHQIPENISSKKVFQTFFFKWLRVWKYVYNGPPHRVKLKNGKVINTYKTYVSSSHIASFSSLVGRVCQELLLRKGKESAEWSCRQWCFTLVRSLYHMTIFGESKLELRSPCQRWNSHEDTVLVPSLNCNNSLLLLKW